MNRRDAMKALTTLVGTTGLTVTPVTATDADNIALIILKPHNHIPHETAKRLTACWEEGMKGTLFEGVRTVIISDMDVEFVRGKR